MLRHAARGARAAVAPVAAVRQAAALGSLPLRLSGSARSAEAPAPAPLGVQLRRPLRQTLPLSLQQRRRFSAQPGGGAEAEKKDADKADGKDAEAKDGEEAQKAGEGEKAGAQAAAATGAPPMGTSPASKGEHEETPRELLEQELKEAEAKLKQEKHDLLLSLADFENNKKQHLTERQARQRNAVANFAKEVIQVYDQFDELAHSEDAVANLSDSCKALQEGIAMTRDLYKSTLEKFDVVALAPEPGAAMVAARFESVGEVESSDLAANSVAEVVRPGWILEPDSSKPVVLRKAQVKTARQGPATPPPP